MGLDSVEIVMGWEETFGISITNAEAERLRTPRQAVDLVASALAADEDQPGVCLTLRAFHRLRHSITTIASISRNQVRPDVRLGELINGQSQHTWAGIRSSSGISSLPGSGWFSQRTVGDLARWTIIHAAKDLKSDDEPWTRSQIRMVVRSVIADIIGRKDFEDEHDFAHDMGID